MENFCCDNSSIVNLLDVNTNKSQSNEIVKDSENDDRKSFLKKEASVSTSIHDYYEFYVLRSNKFRINKSLLAFRITQFLWYGAGILPSMFLVIFLKQRGLTLVELSATFSMIFIFQFMSCAIIGVIADKIGNTKPIIKFLMLSSMCVLFLILLTPNINNISCISQQSQLNNSEILEHRKNLSSCFFHCSFNTTKYVSKDRNQEEDSSLIQKFDSQIHNTNICNISTNISLDPLIDVCCNACINNSKVQCVMGRHENIVVVYAVLILAFYSVWSTTFRLMNFTAVSLAEKNYSDFGKELSVGKSADLLVLIIISFVLNKDKSTRSETNYDTVLWIAAGIMFCAFLSLYMTKVPNLPPGKNLTKMAFKLLRNIDIFSFILLIFVSGNACSFYFAFHIVYLETLNASSSTISLHCIAINLYGFLILLTSKWWIKKFGTNKMFVIGLFFRGAGFVAYSYIQNTWWCLIIDICSAFCDDLFWVAVVTHCWRVAPVGFAATLTACTGSVHSGIGRSSGVFFGGMLMNYMGARITFRIMAQIIFSTAFFYSIFIYQRSKSRKLLS